MKKNTSILIGLTLIMICGAVYLFWAGDRSEVTSGVNEPRNPLASIFKETPSPYSFKWDSKLGRIVDQEGNGVGGATITFLSRIARNCKGETTGNTPEWHGTVVAANEAGEFNYPSEIWEVKEDGKKPQIRVIIDAAGFLSRKTRVGVNYSVSDVAIDIFRRGRIEGQLIDPNGMPIANAPIKFNTHSVYKNPSSSCVGCFSASPKTNDKGWFVIENVAPGEHTIKYPGYNGGCGMEKAPVIPFADYPTFISLTMKDGEEKLGVFLDLRRDGANVIGRVVDNNNRPIAGVQAIAQKVFRSYRDGGYSTTSVIVATAVTDNEGRYVLANIPMGEYQIHAQYVYKKGKNYKSGKALNVYVGGKRDVPFDLVLKRQDDSMGKLTKRNEFDFEVALPDGLGEREMMIVDPRGNGIAGAKVIFKNTVTVTDRKTKKQSQKEYEWTVAPLITDGRGIFALPQEVIDSETETMQSRATIEAEGFKKRQVHLEASNIKKRRIDILPYSVITGKLIGIDGKPIKGNVWLGQRLASFKNPGMSISSSGCYSSMPTGMDGKFSFGKIPEGGHVIRYEVANVDGKTSVKGGIIVYTQGGENVDDVVIDLGENSCGVRGRVLNMDGKAVKKAYVRLSKSISWGRNGGSFTSSPEVHRSELSNRKGDYTIEGVRAGVYEIEAVVDGKRKRTSEKMTIAVSDGQAMELDIRLKP